LVVLGEEFNICRFQHSQLLCQRR